MMKSNTKKKKSTKSNPSVPIHVAIIMDGNGRWAQSRGLARIEGHKASTKAIRETVEGAMEKGIQYLSLFTFSTENWIRPKSEIHALFKVFTTVLKEETPELHNKGIKLIISGDLSKFPLYMQKQLKQSLELTKDNHTMVINFCLDYSGKKEILEMVKKIVSHSIPIENITDDLIDKYLLTYPLPPVDLLIRTSGEKRISNFMLWQIAYAEFYFSNLYWPDFDKNEFFKAIADYQKRDRRFGGL